MTLPPPVPPRNTLATVALVLGIAGAVIGFAVGVFLLGLDALVAFLLPGALGLAALILGIVALVRANRHGGRGTVPAVLAVVFGLTPFAALFLGRILAAELLGM